MLVGLVSAIAIVIVGIRFHAFAFDPVADTFAELQVATISVNFVCLCLVFSIARLGRHRFFSPEDIDGSGLAAGTPQG